MSSIKFRIYGVDEKKITLYEVKNFSL